VWLYGTRVAELSGHGSLNWRWTRDAYERWGSNSRVLSDLLPITRPGSSPHPRRISVFIDNLLPEGNARVNYAIDVGVAPDDTFGLIAHYGRDTAGALVFQPFEEDAPDRRGEYVPLDEREVGERLRLADRHSPTDPASRGVESISLAGMQPKIALHRINGVWHACRAGAPSTWIVKVAHPTDSIARDVVDTEVLSLDLARAVGLTSISAELHDFTGIRAIAVRRYDRITVEGGVIERVHQEDLAQALGVNTRDPNRKFQRGNDLPSLQAAAKILWRGGGQPWDLLRLAAFNLLIGNTDAHAKNHSFIRDRDGTVQLAPAYDVAMHLHHERADPLSALDINGKFHLSEIGILDVVAEGDRWGLPPEVSRALVIDVAERLDRAIAAVDLRLYPGVPSAALDVVSERVGRALGLL
jgi:serine/threonine-protein kinase HipA